MATRKKVPKATLPNAFRGPRAALGPLAGKLKSAKGGAGAKAPKMKKIGGKKGKAAMGALIGGGQKALIGGKRKKGTPAILGGE